MIIDEKKIDFLLKKEVSSKNLDRILDKAMCLEKLSWEEISVLIQVNDSESINKLFSAAEKVKEKIYGKRIVFFAPLYISNYCNNDCLYCAFRVKNNIPRAALTIDEIKSETEALLKQGHKRILLVTGEAYPKYQGLSYVYNAIDEIYKVKTHEGSIRRINVNIAPLSTDDFKELKKHNIGTYQIFQETYHKQTYQSTHKSGPKANYENRLETIDRAFQAGIDDVGVGVLFGLYNWKYEILALLQHIKYLEMTFGMGPHTISVPRLESAEGAPLAINPPQPVSDDEFYRLIAILRLVVPYTGIILSTRELPKVRKKAIQLGVSQISAGSKTNPGGYGKHQQKLAEQFSLGDHRPLDEVIYELLTMDYIPSFCTACYRLGRTGLDFMEYAKPGDIKKKCDPNALISFKEYLNDFAPPKTKDLGEKKLSEWINGVEDLKMKKYIEKSFIDIDNGVKDIYV